MAVLRSTPRTKLVVMPRASPAGVGNLFQGLDLSNVVCKAETPSLRSFCVRHDADITLPVHELEWSVCRCGGTIVVTSEEHCRSLYTSENPRHLHFLCKTDGSKDVGPRLQVARNVAAVQGGDPRFKHLARRFEITTIDSANGSGVRHWLLSRRPGFGSCAGCEVCPNRLVLAIRLHR